MNKSSSSAHTYHTCERIFVRFGFANSLKRHSAWGVCRCGASSFSSVKLWNCWSTL